MAITWTDIHTREMVKTTHEGLVVAAGHMKVERVMSDIWSEEWYATVWNPEMKMNVEVHIGSAFECFAGPRGTAAVDLLPEHAVIRDAVIKEQAEARAREEAARCAKQKEEQRVREHNAPVRGKRMKVIRGRKVPIGTEGTVFWAKDGRVGLDLDGMKDANGRAKNVVWVDATYLVNAEPLPVA